MMSSPFCENMTSSTKLDVWSIPQCRHRQHAHKNWWEFGCAVFELCKQTDRQNKHAQKFDKFSHAVSEMWVDMQTDRQTDRQTCSSQYVAPLPGTK